MPHKLTEPLHWGNPRLVFVNSMSDLFQEDVPDEYIVPRRSSDGGANWHTYQVLTKRSERLRDLLATKLSFAASTAYLVGSERRGQTIRSPTN